MVLITILLVTLVILAIMTIALISAIGSVGIVLFGDVIVCAVFIVWLIKHLAKKKR